jgi:hypothetical protein
VSKHRLVCIIALVGSFTLLLSGCNNAGGLQDKLYAGEEWTNVIEPDNNTPTLKNDQFSLFLEPGMAVRVEDHKTNVTWSTNAQTVTDTASTNNQFTLKYYDASGTVLQMSSQTDSVDKNQAQAYIVGESLCVRYRLGDYEKTVDDVPSVLSDKRFQELFISKLDANGKAEMEDYYKYYENEKAWRIKSKGKNNFKNILRIMIDVGYTEENLAEDNTEYGLATDATSKAFFTIVLKYELGADGLVVSAPSEFIEFSSDYPPYEISLLEGFGKQKQGSEGYIFVPDGSGALMHFARSYQDRTELALPVYGLDLTQTSNVLQNNKQDNEKVLLPVFGMKDGDGVFMAVMDGAESKATIHAHKAGEYFSRNAVYASFRLIDRDKVYLSGNDSHSANVLVFEKQLFDKDCRVEYCFLKQDSDYVDMAITYRNRLAKAGKLSPGESSVSNNVPLLVETLDGLVGYKNFLGVSYTGVISMTSYAENREIMADLLKSGITNLDWKLTGWFNEGYYHDYISKIKLQKELGDRKQLDETIEYAKANGINVYPDVEFQTFAKSSLGFIPLRDASRGLDFSSVQIPVLSLAQQAENSGSGLVPAKLHVRSPGKIQELTDRFLKSYKSLNIDGISLRSSGSALYSDFNEKNTIDRVDSQDIMIQHLATVKNTVKNVMLSEAFAYALPYASAITEMPLGSSNFSTTDEDVPFVQIVLHGNTTMYGDAMNLVPNSSQYLLKSIEYGVFLHYQLTACESSNLKNTEYTTNYSSNYTDWKKSLISSYTKVNNALSKVGNARISDHHSVMDKVYCTEYDNGVRVYVNYSSVDKTVEDGIVPASGFFVAQKT